MKALASSMAAKISGTTRSIVSNALRRVVSCLTTEDSSLCMISTKSFM
ncbi:MAG: hypothetical protein IPH06_08835 [Alphaproteobacteria bacterium]|nr:hypothetical protein [Alphaproteobacteria bacterium]QQS58105.1 MAG: hypothetical protein IPN28_04595 [Alphaproteobacteria bacterium]